jgi:hypothetical protein
MTSYQESYLEKNCNLKAISSIRVNNDGLLELRKLFLHFLLSEVRHDTAGLTISQPRSQALSYDTPRVFQSLEQEKKPWVRG